MKNCQDIIIKKTVSQVFFLNNDLILKNKYEKWKENHKSLNLNCKGIFGTLTVFDLKALSVE